MNADNLAFERLYADYYRRMMVYASTFRSILESERADLAHDIIVHAYLKRDRYDPSRPLNAWIYALARNYLIDWQRAQRRRLTEPLDESTTQSWPTVETLGGESGDEALLLKEIEVELAKMDDRDREIAQLAFYGELTSAAVARVMGIPAGTVRWRISVIRRRVRKACGRSHETK